MSITNEEAMRKLRELQASANTDSSGFLRGALIGAAGAYMLADVITPQQYTDISKSDIRTLAAA